MDGAKGSLVIRRMLATDGAVWVRLRAGLYPDARLGMHALHVTRLLWNDDGNTVAFLAEASEAPIGFIELSLRQAAEGCQPGVVAYVEAWYVAPAWRARGIGGALLHVGEQWARATGCRELATHTPMQAPHVRLPAAHAALGFTPVSRITCWRKALDPTAH